MASDEEPVAASRRRQVLRSPYTVLAVVTLAAAALAGALTAYYEYTRPAVYQSASSLLIDQAPAIAASGDEGVLAKLSRLRFKYAGIATTETFDAQVAQQTGLSPGAVHAALSPFADQTSLLLSMIARTRSPETSKLIAQVAAQQMQTYAQTEQTAANIPTAQQVTFTVLSPAALGVRVAPDHRRAELVGVLVFVAVLVAVFLAATLVRSSRPE